MNKIFSGFFVVLLTFLGTKVSAQTGLSEVGKDTLQIYIGSGNNQVLVPGLALYANSAPTIEIQSSAPELLEPVSFEYNVGDPTVLVLINEKGQQGEAILSTIISHDNGTDTIRIVIQIVPYRNPGMVFEIHDAVFWQEAVPLSSIPVFDTIIQSSAGPYSALNYDNIPITVNQDCTDPAVCTGHDFFTSLFKGFFIPPVSGTYSFYMHSQDRHALWFSENENFSEAELIAARSTEHGNVGTEAGSGRTKSLPQELEAGKVYAFYATQWIIHTTMGGIEWEGPEISRDYIPGEHMMPYYDVEKPSAPENLNVLWKTSTEMMLEWQPSDDNGTVSGYNLYLNGIRTNNGLIKNTQFQISGLQEETSYHILVTAVDRVGNESFVSNLLATETFQNDTNPPTPPLQLNVIQTTGLALQIQWSGAADSETEVVGYYIYVDGELYNTESFLPETETILHNLQPNTTYTVTIEAVDAGLNKSDPSQEFPVTTGSFDPTGPSLGEKTAKIIVHNQNTSWNEGFGLNGPYENGTMVNNTQVRNLVKEFRAGAVRWGAISANSKSFDVSTGQEKANTYAKMLSLANEIGARFALTVGVQNGIDFRTDSTTFLNLLEYLAGESTTTWGAVRAEEGYSEPLLQQGKGILLEFGNEVWGAAAHDAEIGSDYSEYAQWVRRMAEVVKSSPYYDPEKIIMVYSGRNSHPDLSYGINNTVLTGDRGEVGCLAVSGYLGGNLDYDPEIPQGESELDYYKNGIDLMSKNLEGLELTIKDMLSLTGTIKTFYLYESNMTTSSYNGRFGQAVLMTDYMASSMNYGSIVPSVFHLTGGQWRITQPAENYNPLPLYNLGKYFNRFCKGNIMKTELITNGRLTNAFGNEIQFEPLGVHAYNRNENFGIAVINRDFENSYTFQLELPSNISFNDQAKIYTLWEDDFSSYNTNIDSVTVNLSEDSLIHIPKHSMVVIAVTGEDPGYEKLPLGYYDRVRPDSLSISSSRNFIIDTNRGTELIRTEVLPENVFSTAAVLDIIENTTESVLTPLSGGRLHIKASGKCEDEGHIKIHVYAADNHELSDTITVTVTNQGVDCPATDVSIIEHPENWLFYPNPASDRIVINQNLDVNSLVRIYSQTGALVQQSYLYDGFEIPTKNLKTGLYIVGVLKPDGSYVSEKLQKQ